VANPEKIKTAIFDANNKLKEERKEITLVNTEELSEEIAESNLKAKIENTFANIKNNEDFHHFELPHDQKIENKVSVDSEKYSWSK
jgi:hypothetical protein